MVSSYVGVCLYICIQKAIVTRRLKWTLAHTLTLQWVCGDRTKQSSSFTRLNFLSHTCVDAMSLPFLRCFFCFQHSPFLLRKTLSPSLTSNPPQFREAVLVNNGGKVVGKPRLWRAFDSALVLLGTISVGVSHHYARGYDRPWATKWQRCGDQL